MGYLRHSLAISLASGGVVFGTLACAGGSDSTIDQGIASPSGCENTLKSDRPCVGLLPICPVVYEPAFLRPVALTDCVGEHINDTGTIDFMRQAPDVPGFNLWLSSGCFVFVDLVVEPGARIPAWSWLAIGQSLDVELWHAGGEVRGGSPVWLTLRDPGTGDFLFTHYQLDWQLINEGRVGEMLEFDVEVAPAVCEAGMVGLLNHQYDLRFRSEKSTEVVGEWEFAIISGENGSLLHVQTEDAGITYGYLGATGFHSRLGTAAWFSAWPEVGVSMGN